MFISGSVLDNGHSYTSGRHASLMTSGSRGTIQEATQLREGLLTGTLTGQKVNYLDSGYSEEDADQQVTSCLMKTSSGSIYIPPSKFGKPEAKRPGQRPLFTDKWKRYVSFPDKPSLFGQAWYDTTSYIQIRKRLSILFIIIL